MITGNSTSLARWHTRLGYHSAPFVAGLSSLSSDGGSIALMDIVIERVYPLAFTNASKGAAYEPPWNEEEESIRQDKWQVSCFGDDEAIERFRSNTTLETPG
jgi:breast cancer 2 susceptibility protein